MHHVAVPEPIDHRPDGSPWPPLERHRPSDYDYVWMYVSNVVQAVEWAHLMAFVRRYRSAGVPVCACYAWKPADLKIPELAEAGVVLTTAPLSADELRAFFP